MADGGYRFNALKEPMEFIRKIHNIPVVNFMNGRKVIENYYEENWYVKFYELKDLLHLWRKRTEKNKEIKGEIDFGKYWETVTLFLKLIPATYEGGVLKAEWRYQEEQEIIKRELRSYYEKVAWGGINPRVGELVGKLTMIINLIESEKFDKTQKEFLLEEFAEYVDGFGQECDGFIKNIQVFQERYTGKKVPEGDFEFCQHLLEKVRSS